jgi:hypothetical protein
LSRHRIAVFLGPSCPEHEARERLSDADYYSPAARGSFYNIINDGYHTIVLIDGLFYASLSVWHKEIMCALDSDIKVIGASSMGALRAAELRGTGIIGVGAIFEWYRDGLIDGDDEVALLHKGREEDFAGLTIPLVNLRWNLRRAVEQGLIEGRQADLIIESAKRLCFTDRTLDRILDPLHERFDVGSLKGWLELNFEDPKKMDALKALKLAGRGSAEARTSAEPVLRQYETIHMNVGIEYFWSERLNSIRAKVGERETTLSGYLERIEPDDPGYRDLVRARRYHKLIVGWARELRLKSADAEDLLEGGANWAPDKIDIPHRRATGLTLLDLARERRDAKLCYAMQRQFCAEANSNLIRELDQILQDQAQPSCLDWPRMITLDGSLIYALWRLGMRKNVVQCLIPVDGNGEAAQDMEDRPETAEMILNFVEFIDRCGASLFGYAFDPAREILLTCQYLNRLDTIDPVLG